ncbi:MAG: hypothetical protein PHX58_12040 [Desulfovibrio sp.]|nr:hypothetical protein [Desulfovibrio sp.]
MKKLIIAGVLLVAAAVYFGVITIRTGEGEFAVGLNTDRAGQVIDTIKEKAGRIKDAVWDEQQ